MCVSVVWASGRVREREREGARWSRARVLVHLLPPFIGVPCCVPTEAGNDDTDFGGKQSEKEEKEETGRVDAGGTGGGVEKTARGRGGVSEATLRGPCAKQTVGVDQTVVAWVSFIKNVARRTFGC